MQTTAIFLAAFVLPMCFAGETCSKDKGCYCGVAGKWENELESQMTLTCEDGQLSGTYNSAVGQAKYTYVLTGRYTVSTDNVVELGWVVAWNNIYGNSHSSTSWSGIYYPVDDIIRTQWLLTSYRERKHYWDTTTINHDEFKRIH